MVFDKEKIVNVILELLIEDRKIIMRGFAGILVLIILVAIVALAAAFYFGRQSILPLGGSPSPSQSPDLTATWKTFTNPRYNWSIKYPSNLEPPEGPLSDEELLEGWEVDPDIGIGFSPQNSNRYILFITVVESDYEFFQRRINQLLSMNVGESRSEKKSTTTRLADRTIDGELGIVEEEKSVDNKPIVPNVYIKKGNYIYRIGGSYSTDEELKTIELMISTFKFLGQSDQTVSWKTYTNKQLGYSFKFPFEWSLNFKESEFVQVASVSLDSDLYLRGIGSPSVGEAWVIIERVETKGKDSEEIAESGQDVPLYIKTLFKEKGGVLLAIRGRYWKDGKTEVANKKLIDQILSTFRFD